MYVCVVYYALWHDQGPLLDAGEDPELKRGVLFAAFCLKASSFLLKYDCHWDGGMGESLDMTKSPLKSICLMTLWFRLAKLFLWLHIMASKISNLVWF